MFQFVCLILGLLGSAQSILNLFTQFHLKSVCIYSYSSFVFPFTFACLAEETRGLFVARDGRNNEDKEEQFVNMRVEY